MTSQTPQEKKCECTLGQFHYIYCPLYTPPAQEELFDCSGCSDPNSEGTHQGHSKQHGCVGCLHNESPQPKEPETQQNLTTIAQEFEEKFEFHDLGKPNFTLCENISKEGCNGGVSISEEEEEIAKKMLENIKSFWLSHIRTMVEEMKKEVEGKIDYEREPKLFISDILSILNKYCE